MTIITWREYIRFLAGFLQHLTVSQVLVLGAPLGGACHLWSLASCRFATARRGSRRRDATLLRFPEKVRSECLCGFEASLASLFFLSLTI